MGWTIPRQVGSAVVRNRFKRWLRNFFRSKLKSIEEPMNLDMNIVFLRAGTEFYQKLKYAEFTKDMEKVWVLLQRRI